MPYADAMAELDSTFGEELAAASALSGPHAATILEELVAEGSEATSAFKHKG
jgi:hypothetical protein